MGELKIDLKSMATLSDIRSVEISNDDEARVLVNLLSY